MYYVLKYICCVVFTSNTSRIPYIYAETLRFTHVSFSDKTIRVDVWTCGQRVLTRTPLPQPHPPHPHTHLPTSRLEWSSRTMSHLEGNPSAASSSVVASSAANCSSAEADGSAASSAPGSNPVDEGEPPEAVLQPPNTAETTVSENKSFSVTIQPPMAGRRKWTAWVWRNASRFAPTINDNNVLCLIKAADGTACKHLMKWSPGDSNKKGTGTTGLANHIKKKHPTQYKEAMELIGTKQDRNAPVAAAIGEESRDDKKTAK